MIDKKILIITPYFPYPIDSGGAQAQFHMIDFLRKHMHISIAYTCSPKRNLNNERKLQELWPEVTFYPFVIPRKKFLFRKCRQLLRAFNSWPEENKYVVNKSIQNFTEDNIDYHFINYLGGIIEENKIDLIQFEFPKFQDMVYAFPHVKRIFVQHEIQFIRNLRFLKTLENLPPCDYYQYKMLKATELAAMQACDAVITLTEIDRKILVDEKVTTPIFVSPAVIPVPELEANDGYSFNNKLVFLGSSNHGPNNEGIMWFLEHAWGYIQEKNPSMKLQIIGIWQHRFINKITQTYKNVEMTGYVPSIDPYLKNSIMIVPILTGSGMRMKIVDAANHKTPFVTTQVGVEGLAFKNGEDCFIESDAILFAEKVLELAANKELQETFRANAFRKINEIYPTSELLDKRLEVYKTLLTE